MSGVRFALIWLMISANAAFVVVTLWIGIAQGYVVDHCDLDDTKGALITMLWACLNLAGMWALATDKEGGW